MSVIPNGIGWDRLARLFRMPRHLVSDVHVLSLVCIARMIECSCARALFRQAVRPDMRHTESAVYLALSVNSARAGT